MCGIAGILGFSPEEARESAEQLLSALQHRGPDDHGILEIKGSNTNAAWAVHSRLSILDLSPLGHQPMVEGELSVTFNGLIYNFKELRQELSQKGEIFRSNCDTEVILKAFKHWGPQCVERFNGMFAFAMFDSKQKQVWLFRDRLGVKPLYYCASPSGGFVFASEVKALLSLNSAHLKKRLNLDAIESFLAMGAVWGLDSAVESIKSVEPGNYVCLSWDGRINSVTSYWSLDIIKPKTFSSRGEFVEQTQALLTESVKLRLVADVPIGIFLSGGVDSSALATLASKIPDQKVHTIAVGFDDDKFDESADALAIANILGTRHSEVKLSSQTMVDHFGDALECMDQPTVDGFNTYFVSQAAKELGLKVALSGVGADELFGGYETFKHVGLGTRIRKSVGGFAPLLHGALSTIIPKSSRKLLKSVELFARHDSELSVYLLRRELFLSQSRRALWGLPPHSDSVDGLTKATKQYLTPPNHFSDIENRVSYMEIKGFLGQMLLPDADIFSMCHPLEIRGPYLDYRLVEHVLSAPGRWKKNDGRPKPLLIDSVAGLPKESYSRPKRGFTFPWDFWLRGSLSAYAADVLNENDVWKDIGFRPEGVKKLWNEFCVNRPGATGLQIVSLIALANFAKRHRLRA